MKEVVPVVGGISVTDYVAFFIAIHDLKLFYRLWVRRSPDGNNQHRYTCDTDCNTKAIEEFLYVWVVHFVSGNMQARQEINSSISSSLKKSNVTLKPPLLTVKEYSSVRAS